MTPAPTVWHSLRYADARAAIAFLTDVLGFTATLVVGADDDPSVVVHAQLAWPEGGGVMLGSVRETPEFPLQPGHGAAYVVTADPGAVHDRAVAAGANILSPLADQDGRGPSFALADAEGNLWSFGTYPGEEPSDR